MKKNSLTVAFYQLTVTPKTRKKDIEKPFHCTLTELLAAAVQSIKDKKAPTSIGGVHRLIALEDIKQNGEHEFQLLLGMTNTDVPDLSIKDIKTGARRTAGKKKSEGWDFTAHILIRCAPNGQIADLRMTRGASVSSTLVCKLLNLISRHLSSDPQHHGLFNFPSPSGPKAPPYKVSYTFECDSAPNETMKNALKSGELKELTLINNRPMILIDQRTGLREESTSVTFKPSSQKVLSFGSVSAFLNGKKEDYDAVKLRFKTGAKAEPKDKTMAIEDFEKAFTLTKEIKLTSDLESGYASINKEIIDLMRAL